MTFMVVPCRSGRSGARCRLRCATSDVLWRAATAPGCCTRLTAEARRGPTLSPFSALL